MLDAKERKSNIIKLEPAPPDVDTGKSPLAPVLKPRPMPNRSYSIRSVRSDIPSPIPFGGDERLMESPSIDQVVGLGIQGVEISPRS